MLQAPSAASRAFGSPPSRSSHRRRQQRMLLKATAVVALGLAVVGAFAWKQASRPANLDPTFRMTTRVLTLAKALDRHAARAARKAGEALYPTTAAFPAFVQALPEGAALLANPYGDPPQAASATPGPGLHTAAALKAGEERLMPNTVLGAGTGPAAIYTDRTFGALVYDHDPKTDSYVLYGIGKLGDRAVVAAEAHSKL